jgi:6-phosphogluconolactonase
LGEPGYKGACMRTRALFVSFASWLSLASIDCAGQPAAAPPPRPSRNVGPSANAAGPPIVAYASGYAPVIDVFFVDPASGALSLAGTAPSFGPAPSYLAFNRDATTLYALDESTPGRVGAYHIDPASGALTFLNAVSSGGSGPAHISLDTANRYVLVANYSDGTVSVLPVQAGGDGRLDPPRQTLSVGAQAHMIVTDPSNRFAFVPCKGADYIAQFLFDAEAGKLTPNATPLAKTAPGAGPRHLAFHPNGKFAYVINELDNTMTAYTFDAGAGTLAPIETQSTLPAGFTGKDTAAEVWVHPSGKWLFGSNRGDDSVAIFSIDEGSGTMTPRGHVKTGGTTPRDFTFDAAGTFLYVANQGSGDVRVFRFDPARGELSASGAPVHVDSPSFVGLARLPGRPKP